MTSRAFHLRSQPRDLDRAKIQLRAALLDANAAGMHALAKEITAEQAHRT